MVTTKAVLLQSKAIKLRLQFEPVNFKFTKMTTDRKRDIFTPKISINLRYYTDDGWSGTNFDRPDWKRMLADIVR